MIGGAVMTSLVLPLSRDQRSAALPRNGAMGQKPTFLIDVGRQRIEAAFIVRLWWRATPRCASAPRQLWVTFDRVSWLCLLVDVRFTPSATRFDSRDSKNDFIICQAWASYSANGLTLAPNTLFAQTAQVLVGSVKRQNKMAPSDRWGAGQSPML
jgi:hypothetical protein